MHSNLTYAYKVGLMVATGLLILAIFIVVSEDASPFRGRYNLSIIFNNVAGLEVDSPVRLAGMEVGKVKDMRIRDGKIEVIVEVDRETKIRRDTKATIESIGLIGEKYVGFTMGSDTMPYLEDGATIIGEDPVSIGEMLIRGESAIKNVEETLKSLDRVLTKREIFEDVEKILNNIETISRDLRGLIKENRKDISSTLKDLSKSSREFKEVVKEFRINVNEISSRLRSISQELDEGLKGKGKDIGEIITSLKGASNTLEHTLKKLERAEGTAGRLIHDEEMAKNLSAAIKDLRELAADLRAHPWKLIRKK